MKEFLTSIGFVCYHQHGDRDLYRSDHLSVSAIIANGSIQVILNGRSIHCSTSGEVIRAIVTLEREDAEKKGRDLAKQEIRSVLGL